MTNISSPAHPSIAARPEADRSRQRGEQAQHPDWGGGGLHQRRDHPLVPRHPGHGAPAGVIRSLKQKTVSTQGWQ